MMQGFDQPEVDELAELSALMTFDRGSLLQRGLALGIVASGLAGTGLARAGVADASQSQISSTLTTALIGPIVSLDPDGPGTHDLPTVTVIAACYDPLVYYTWPFNLAELKRIVATRGVAGLTRLQPGLTEHWETSRDKRTYRFHLRNGVKSSFGNELTAQDVVWSYRKTYAFATNRRASLYMQGGLTSSKNMKIINDKTVEFRLPVANEVFPLAVGFFSAGIQDSTEVRKHATSKDPWGTAWLANNTAGFGPYVVSSKSSDGSSVTLKARPGYYGPKPAFKTVIQRSVPEVGTRLQLLLAGQVQFAYQLSQNELDAVRKSNINTTTRINDSSATTLQLTFKPPWNDPKVRQAIAQAIPYTDIIMTAFRTHAKRFKSILLPFTEGYTEKFWHYETNFDEARKVLSGIATPLTLSYKAEFPGDQQMAVLIQQGFKKAGFNLQIQAVPTDQWFSHVFSKDGKLDFVIDGLVTPAFNTPAQYFGFYALGGFADWFGYTNARLKRDNALASSFGKGRAPAIVDAQMIFMRDLPIFPVVWQGDEYGHAKSVKITRGSTANALLTWQDFARA
jgi:peptide/nickel transport system substrate-binding protein